uniref:Reverse transcriptase zinc-binding domain-containing protein n=1 Tax=Aegilops tauschii subsp. strangulata TaxID=200361 RepID=A0A452YRW9_AEGTS
MNAKFFLWLVSLDRCWSAERRARHGLPHDPHCKLCDQEFETMDHLLVQCVFSRITWHEILSWCRLPVPLPDANSSFFAWWSALLAASPASPRKGLNSLVALTAWSIWKHRNAALFDDLRPSTDALVHTIKEEARLWSRAGALGLAFIIPIT